MSRADVEAAVRAGRLPCAFDEHMEFRITAWEDGRVVVEADVDERFHNPAGVLHGGYMASLVDTAIGNCMFSLIGADDSCTNFDLNLKFLRPVRSGTVTATATPIKAGRSVMVIQCDVHHDGKPVARAESQGLRLPA